MLNMMHPPTTDGRHQIGAAQIMFPLLFVTIFSTYIALRLVYKTGFARKTKIGIIAFLAFSIFTFPVIYWTLMRSGAGIIFPRFVYIITAFLLAYAVYVFFIVLFHDIFYFYYALIKFVIVRFRKTKKNAPAYRTEKYILARNKLRSLIILSLAFVLTVIGIIQALVQPPLKTREISFAKTGDTEIIKIVHLSDIHANIILGDSWVEKIVKKVNEAGPDIVLITGDLADGPPVESARYIQPLKNLKAPVYFVVGNHEILWDKKGWLQEFEKLGIPVLNGTRAVKEIKGKKLLIAGLEDHGGGPWKFILPEAFNKLLENAPDNDFKILMYHRPEIFPDAAKAGYNLVLAGHTHNGQTFPINVFAELVTPYPVGFYYIDDSVLFTSPGAGFVGPPLRLFVPKEITILDVKIDKR